MGTCSVLNETSLYRCDQELDHVGPHRRKDYTWPNPERRLREKLRAVRKALKDALEEAGARLSTPGLTTSAAQTAAGEVLSTVRAVLTQIDEAAFATDVAKAVTEEREACAEIARQVAKTYRRAEAIEKRSVSARGLSVAERIESGIRARGV